MKRALLILNSKSRNGEALAKLAQEELVNRGFTVIAPDSRNGHYTEIIEKYKNDVDCIIAGGGDGTVRLCLEGALKVNLPLGILPLGTANNLARNIGLPLDLKLACDVIERGSLIPIDIAFVNEIPFFNVAGLGLSVKINKSLPRDLKKRWGVFAYVILAFKLVNRARPFKAQIKADNQTINVNAFQITVCNGRHYGAGLVIDESAAIDDSRFDILSTEVKSWSEALRALPTFIFGKNYDQSGIRKFSARELEIRTTRPMQLDTDGDITTTTPAKFKIEPKRIEVFAQALPLGQ